MRRVLLLLPLAAILIAGGAAFAYATGHGSLAPDRKPSLAIGGAPLLSGAEGIPPQPTFAATFTRSRQAGDYQAQLDGKSVAIRSGGAGAATLEVPSQALGSRHHLEMWHPGIAGGHDDAVQVDFRIVEPLQVSVAWLSSPGSTSASVTWSRQPADHAPVEALLRAAGASVATDGDRTIATWSSVHAGQRLAFTIPARYPAADGGYLAADMNAAITVPSEPASTVQLSNEGPADTSGLRLQMYYVATPAALTDLAQHARQIAVLSPSFYSLDGAGNLQGNVASQAVAIARQNGIDVEPLVSNLDFDTDQAHGLITNTALVPQVATQLVDEAHRMGYSGYQLDFENIRADDRDGFSRFSAAVGQRLRSAGLKYSIAVIPRRATSSPSGVSAVYDYPALTASANWLTMMAYDEHTRQEDPGPVAGLDWVRQVIGFSSARLDTAHVYLGVPLYGRDFSLTAAPVADGYGAIVSQAAVHGGSVSWQFDIATTRAEYVSDGVQHVAWIDSRPSLQAKTALARDMHLAGVSAWRLGFEDPDFWSLWPSR